MNTTIAKPRKTVQQFFRFAIEMDRKPSDLLGELEQTHGPHWHEDDAVWVELAVRASK
ncbi:hypothetical protein [Arthrobacter sp. HLT1-21]